MVTGTSADDILNGTAGDDTIDGLGGSDMLYGDAGQDDLRGGDGEDFLRGQAGDDTLQGGAGDDFLSGGAGDDRFDGGAGVDRVVFGDAPGGVTVDLTLQGSAQNTGLGLDTLVGIEHVGGSNFNDAITGDASDNWLWGAGGSDTMSGGGGNDLVTVGNGAHLVDGGAGVDTLSYYSSTLTGPVTASLAAQGSAQNTTQGLMTISGFENLSGTVIGGDTLTGDGAANVLAGWGGSDSLSGGGGNDTLLGDGFIHVDSPLGGSGPISTFLEFSNDGLAEALPGNDTLDGGAGDDNLRAGDGDDLLSGGDDDDFLRGQGGNDTLQGGAGEDFLNGGAGDDAMDGGAGIDRASFGDAPGGVTVNLSLMSAQNTGFGLDTLIGVEQVSGTAFNDVLTGDGNANWLWGVGGADTVSAGGGGDLVSVGNGAVQADGGAGVDTLAFYSETLAGPVTVSLAEQGSAQNTTQGLMTISGFENLSGTAIGGDTLTGDANANVLAGWGGADSLSGGDGNDTLLGDGFIHVDSALGGAGPVTTFEEFDTGGITLPITPAPGNDTLNGGAGDDRLLGGSGNDMVDGGAGADRVVAAALGGQVTTATLGTGADTLELATSLTGTVTVTDFQTGAGGDTLDLAPFLAGRLTNWDGTSSPFTTGHMRLVQSGADTLMEIDADGGGDSYATLITFQNTTATAFAAANLGYTPPGGSSVGTPADDSLSGGLGDDTLSGLAGHDALFGIDGADLLQGGDGDDFLRGNGGSDTLQGGADEDFLNGGLGDDSMDGGAGIDRVSFGDAPGGVTVNLTLTGVQNTGFGQDTLNNIEQVTASNFNDLLTGDSNANWLWGLSGNDTMSAGSGDDLVSLGNGAHVVDGGAGNDTLSFYSDNLNQPVSVTLASPGTLQDTGEGALILTGVENLSGTVIGADTLTGDAGANVLAGWGGSDSLSGGDGNDTLLGDGFIHVDSAQGSAGPITTFEEFDTGGITVPVTPAPGNDTLNGGAGDDRLVAGTGNDIVNGGAGVDRVVAAAGVGQVTTATLGTGADTVELGSSLAGTVTVTDFQAGAGGDTVDLAAFLSARTNWNGTDNPFTSGHLRLHQDGAATLLQIDTDGGGNGFATVIRLEDTSSLALTAANLGYAPPAAAAGGTTADIFEWVEGSPATSVDGGAGVDVVTITTPAVVSGPATIQPSPDGTALLFDLDGDGDTDLTITNVEDIVLNGERVVITGDLSGTGLSPDTIHYVGTAGDNLLDASGMTSVESIDAQGLAGADTLIGGLADDRLEGGAGNDTLNGGADIDTAVFSAARSGYTVSVLGGGEVQVVGPDGTDLLTNIERLQFADGTWSQNQAPGGTDGGISATVGSARTFAATHFGFSDSQGDALLAVRVTTLPATGDLKLGGMAVTAGQVITAADITAGLLRFTPAAEGSASFTFQVQDNGLVGWGSNEDATPNTLTITTSAAPPPPAPAPAPVGTSGNDVVVLDATVRDYSAGAGDDQVTGSYTDDTLRGEVGSDTINGGAGNDTVDGGVGVGYLRGDEGDDRIVGGDDFDDAHGNMGNDTVSGGGGDDWVVGGKDHDQLSGDVGADIVYGNLGDDTCEGGDGADVVRGGQGDDILNGGAGNDWLAGDRGADTMTGGAGADVFHTWAGAGIDRVLDFNTAEGDRVNLLPGTAYSVVQVGADTVIDMGSGNQMLLVGVQLSGLPNGWIFGS